VIESTLLFPQPPWYVRFPDECSPPKRFTRRAVEDKDEGKVDSRGARRKRSSRYTSELASGLDPPPSKSRESSISRILRRIGASRLCPLRQRRTSLSSARASEHSFLLRPPGASSLVLSEPRVGGHEPLLPWPDDVIAFQGQYRFDRLDGICSRLTCALLKQS